MGKKRKKRKEGRYLLNSTAERVRAENVRRLKKYLLLHKAPDLAQQAAGILKRHKGGERELFKQLTETFGGSIKYFAGPKKGSKKKSGGRSTQARSANKARKKKHSSNNPQQQIEYNPAAIVPRAAKGYIKKGKNDTIYV